MLEKYLETHDERYKLFGVRLDTSGSMVDKSIVPKMEQFKPTGVNETLVRNVYNALQEKASKFEKKSLEQRFYQDIGIIVSGGFDAKKIQEFEKNRVPVIGYGVGSTMYSGNFDFTADIVSINHNGKWNPNAKVGRRYNPNKRLEDVI